MGCNVRHVPLGDLVTMTSGGTPDKKNQEYWNGDIPWISAKTLKGDYVISSNLFITEEGLDSSAAKLAPTGSLLLLTRGSGLFKRIPLALVGREVAYNQDIKCLTSKRAGISNRYIFYVLKALEPSINGMLETTGIGAGKLSTDLLEQLPIPVLDENARTNAVNFFDTLTNKLALNTRINGYLEELALAMLREEVVGSFPYGVTTVGAFAKQMSNGATPSRKQPHYWNGGTIPWVKTGEVNNNIIFRTEEHITQEALEKTSVHLLPVDTVVMALYGRGTAGRVGLLKTRATTNQACTAMICSSSSRAFYLYLILQNMFKQIDSLTRGSVQQNLSKDIVADIQIPDITNDYLNDRGFGLIYSKIAEGERENLTLGELRDALLPKLMSGEIDVSNVMVPMKEGKS